MRVLKYLLSTLLLVSSVSFADAPSGPDSDGITMSMKPVPCKDTKALADEVANKYGEEPVWQGDDTEGDSKYTITYNKKTKTWTMIQYNDEKACILGYGNNSPKSKI